MNPETRKFVWDKIKKNYYDCGIRNYWLDEAEPEVHPQQFGHLHFYKGNGAQTALLYPYYYVQMVYDGLKEQGEEEIISLTRAAYPGSQKYGAAVWNGDIMHIGDNDILKKQSRLLSCVFGFGFWKEPAEWN